MKKLRVLFLIVGVAFIGIGILNQEHMDTMAKAIRICLECVGIG